MRCDAALLFSFSKMRDLQIGSISSTGRGRRVRLAAACRRAAAVRVISPLALHMYVTLRVNETRVERVTQGMLCASSEYGFSYWLAV